MKKVRQKGEKKSKFADVSSILGNQQTRLKIEARGEN
jgi:hypothetical protein